MRRSAFAATAIAIALMGALVPGHAVAAAISDSEQLFDMGTTGQGAGQFELASGVASDPTTGHIYVVEEEPDFRVDEFTPWGGFIKAFGWDVAPGPVNEQQEVRVRAASGEFKLSLAAESTSSLPFNATSAEVETALQALIGIGANGVSVSRVAGTTNGATPYIFVIVFKGSLAATDITQLVASNGGGLPSPELEVRTRADGTGGSTGLEACTQESGCKTGVQGDGAGQFARARGVSVDAAGFIYVREVSNHRVQKFTAAGKFVAMFGGEVNKTKTEAAAPKAEQNVCPVSPSDTCQSGSIGTGNGQFGGGLSGGLAVCDGSIFVADSERIQRLSLAGAFEATFPNPGASVNSIACDAASGDIYSDSESKSNVRKLDPGSGLEVGNVAVDSPGALAVDGEGNLFVVRAGMEILEFGPAGVPLSPPACCTAPPLFGLRSDAIGTNSAGDLVITYRSSVGSNFARVFGPPPSSFESPPEAPPEVDTQFAGSVGRDSATLAAEINPHFFTDVHYYFQYGTGTCSAGECDTNIPLPPGSLLTSRALNAPVRTGGVTLEGLSPGTTYHYRVVATRSAGGPSVYGIDPDGAGPAEASATSGLEATFTTFPEALPPKSCVNDALRIGPSVRLPECRAYEMVTPVNKNNGDISTLVDFPNFTTKLDQSAGDGERLTYSSYRSFGDPGGAPYTSQYLANRNPATGWSSEALNSARSIRGFGQLSEENDYRAFSADVCTGWLMLAANPVLASGAPPGTHEIYRRDGCSAGSYEALIQAPSTLANLDDFYPAFLGASEDGKKAILGANDSLVPGAPVNKWQVYYANEGQLHQVCIAPNGVTSGGNCWAGTGPLPGDADLLVSRERFSTVTNAISTDGRRVYWTDSGGEKSGPGTVYMRENLDQEQSALNGTECIEPEMACTVPVSGTKTPKASRFLGASTDGSKALFVVTEGALAGKLYRFEQGAGSTEIAGKVLGGIVGASDDLSRVYFVSEEVLAGTAGATAGKPNLYLDDSGTKTYIATISNSDAVSRAPSDAESIPLFHAARVSPDGRVAVFISTKSLTGYDNVDLMTGIPDAEIYIYEAGSAAPVCVSCNPSGARPIGQPVQGNGNSAAIVPMAAVPTMADTQLYTPRALSTDGRRLFFNSFDALLPRDTNRRMDVYEWDSAAGQADCQQMGAELYVASAAGCLSLISTGESPQDSEFLDASFGGNDAFFTTTTSLLPRDPGLIDVYDARVGGGIAEPPPQRPACQGEACQPLSSQPSNPTPASSSYEGPEDEKPKKKKKHKAKKHKAKKKNAHSKSHNSKKRKVTR